MNIMYLTRSLHLGGDIKCILKLCKELKDEHNIIVVSSGGVLTKEFNELGIKTFEIDNIISHNPTKLLNNSRKLLKIVKDESIDIIHSHHRLTSMLGNMIRRFCDVKVVHTQHLCIEDKFLLSSIALRGIDIITVSEAAKKILVNKANLNPKLIKTVYNTIEPIKPGKEVDERIIKLRNEGKFIIAQISRAIDYKGVFDFIEIGEKVTKVNKDIVFFFIGDGPDLKNMQILIKEKGLEENIILLGAKNNVLDYFDYIDVVLLCSYIEGLPLAPLEAFSSKKVVIATNIDGTNEEISDGENGFLIEQKDTEGFKNKILYLYENKKILEEIGERAYENYKENFSKENYINGHLKVYKELKGNK